LLFEFLQPTVPWGDAYQGMPSGVWPIFAAVIAIAGQLLHFSCKSVHAAVVIGVTAARPLILYKVHDRSRRIRFVSGHGFQPCRNQPL